jgi:hypothetical protein
VSSPAEGGECECTVAGADGFTDLTLKFRRSEIAAALGPVSDGESVVLTLTGERFDGTPVVASDCVRIIRNGRDSHVPSVDVVLRGARPNPFNPVTRITYSLPEAGPVDLSVYDVHGRLVERLVSRVEAAGEHVVEWDASGRPSGVYFYRLALGAFSETRRMVLIK